MVTDLLNKNNAYNVERDTKSIQEDYFLFSDTWDISKITFVLLVNDSLQ